MEMMKINNMEKYWKQFYTWWEQFYIAYNSLMYRQQVELMNESAWVEMNETRSIILEFLKADEILMGTVIL